MSLINNSDQESPFEVVSPVSTPKPKRAAKATPKATPKVNPKAAGDSNGNGNDQAENISLAEGRLLIEMLSAVCENSAGTKFNWAAISDKLGLPSAGATSKRAERLLKRFDLKMSDITGGARGGRALKKAEGDATPAGKRKTGGGRDAPESPTKRQSLGRATLKKEQSVLQSDDGSEGPKKVATLIKVPAKADKVAGGDGTDVEDENVSDV